MEDKIITCKECGDQFQSAGEEFCCGACQLAYAATNEPETEMMNHGYNPSYYVWGIRREVDDRPIFGDL